LHIVSNVALLSLLSIMLFCSFCRVPFLLSIMLFSFHLIKKHYWQQKWREKTLLTTEMERNNIIDDRNGTRQKEQNNIICTDYFYIACCLSLQESWPFHESRGSQILFMD
jgi:hypothetical protein